MRLKINNSLLNERDIEDWLFRTGFSGWGLDEQYGLYLHTWLKRQMVLPSGIADLVGVFDHKHSSRFVLGVAELKNAKIDGSAVSQVCRYADDLLNIARTINDTEGKDLFDPNRILKILVGPRISEKTFSAARGVGALVFLFGTYLDVVIDGPLCLTPEEERARQEKYDQLAVEGALADWVRGPSDDTMKKLIEQIPEKFRHLMTTDDE